MLYSSQSHSNSQMNKFLETMADWYKYADNRKKAVGFRSYVIRSSLAKLYAARNWIPNHEQVLQEYIKLQDPKLFCELHRSIKRDGLTLPQDEISEVVRNFKTLGAWRSKYGSKREADDGLEKFYSPT